MEPTNYPLAPEDPIIYCNGAWVRQSEATVPFMDSGFWYGDGLFETLLVANGKIFRSRKHLERMQTGMRILKIEFPVPDDEVVRLMEETVERNGLGETLLRLMCTRGTLSGAPWKFTGPANLFIGFRYAGALPPLPVKVTFVNEDDYPIARMVPALKSMTYLGNMLAIRDVVAAGAFEPVFVNRDGVVTECAVRNVFFIKGDTLHTPDTSLGILPGVTRDLILELAADMGLAVDMAPILATDIDKMDEAFISSTGIGILPVTWEGFQPTDYPLTSRLKAAVEQQVRQETGG